MFKKKETVLTHAQKIEQAQGKLQAAQIMFTQAQDEVDASDLALEAVVAEAELAMAELRETVASATASKNKNAKFKMKLAEFINLD